jgi:hypothetical protein
VATIGEKTERNGGLPTYGRLELERVGSVPAERRSDENVDLSRRPDILSTPDAKPKRGQNTKQKSEAACRLASLLTAEPLPVVDAQTKSMLQASTVGTGFVFDEGTNTMQVRKDYAHL